MGTPQNNLVKNPVGRPLKYKTVKALQMAIEDYFAYCDNRTRDVYSDKLGETITVSMPAPYTMSGLARAIGLSRQALLNYSERDEYMDTIKDSRFRVEEYNENQLHEGRNAAGVIFNLKNNFGWVDKSEVDNKHEIVQPIIGGLAKKQLDEGDD